MSLVNQKDFVFLILQYNNVNVTMNCIQSILQMENQERIGIVVVDNNSSDGAAEKIITLMKEKEEILFRYEHNKATKIYMFEHTNGCLIDIICRTINDGFSKGNNFGHKYIMEKYSVKYLCVANSDVEFLQSNFVSLVESEYEKTNFDILGPDIWAPTKGVHQNPLDSNIPTLREVNRTIFLNRVALVLLPFIYPLIKKRMNISGTCFNDFTIRAENICLQGACMIYSSKYLDKRRELYKGNSFLFYPETYFYYEEYLQTLWCRKYNCKIIYTPDICVNHLEGVATETISVIEKEKIKFRMKNILDSAKIYRKQLLFLNSQNNVR